MKGKDLREKSDGELVVELDRAKEDLFNLRVQRASGRLESPSRAGDARRRVARIQTIQRERRRAAAEA